jgi:hypothetical protein
VPTPLVAAFLSGLAAAAAVVLRIPYGDVAVLCVGLVVLAYHAVRLAGAADHALE